MKAFLLLVALAVGICFFAVPAQAASPPGFDKMVSNDCNSCHVTPPSAPQANLAVQPLDVGIALLNPTDRTTLQAYYGTAVPSKGARAEFFPLKT